MLLGPLETWGADECGYAQNGALRVTSSRQTGSGVCSRSSCRNATALRDSPYDREGRGHCRDIRRYRSCVQTEFGRPLVHVQSFHIFAEKHVCICLGSNKYPITEVPKFQGVVSEELQVGKMTDTPVTMHLASLSDLIFIFLSNLCVGVYQHLHQTNHRRQHRRRNNSRHSVCSDYLVLTSVGRSSLLSPLASSDLETFKTAVLVEPINVVPDFS